ncbi:MAG: hypothetical protein ACPL7O_09255 [Armatimonadota bacterium]
MLREKTRFILFAGELYTGQAEYAVVLRQEGGGVYRRKTAWDLAVAIINSCKKFLEV